MTSNKREITTVIDLTDLLHGKSLPPKTYDDSDFVTAGLILDCRNQLGEGVIYDDRNHTLLWTDILGCTFHTLLMNRKEPTKVVHTVYTLPKRLCSFGMIEPQEQQNTNIDTADDASLPLLCAWEDGFQLVDIIAQSALRTSSSSSSMMSSGPIVNPSKGSSRLNDGRVDPTGRRFVCGGYYGDTPGVKMKVFQVEQPDQATPNLLVHEPIVDSIEVTNSICWSSDGQTMYLADSPTKQIHAYDYCAESGQVSNKRLLHGKPLAENGVPDGSCVDEEGFLWNAVWKPGALAGSCVQRIDPTNGLVVFTVHMPDTTSQVTCCCFGGENLDILFITTAADSMDPVREPYAGGLYAVILPFRGRPESRLKWALPPKS